VISTNATELFDPKDEALRFLPEGPYPLSAELFGADRFSWVAIQHGASTTKGSLNIYDFKSGTNQSYELPGRPGFAFPTDQGNFVVGCERSVGIFSIADGTFQPFIEGVDAAVEGTIINDGAVWQGNLIFGTKDLKFETKKAGLYLWRAADKRLIQLRNDQICSNGKVIVGREDGSVDLLDIDSPTRQVVAYHLDIANGRLDAGRVVVDLTKDEGVPDGMTLMPDGKSVIISLYNPNPADYGRTIQVRLADGQIEREWRTIGSPQATCPQWVARNGNASLVITTAVEHMSSERRPGAPKAGSLFVVDTDMEWSSELFGVIAPVFRQ
jgi:sugar lactone lactonase YvrE